MAELRWSGQNSDIQARKDTRFVLRWEQIDGVSRRFWARLERPSSGLRRDTLTGDDGRRKWENDGVTVEGREDRV